MEAGEREEERGRTRDVSCWLLMTDPTNMAGISLCSSVYGREQDADSMEDRAWSKFLIVLLQAA